jgi:hypothetical protein
LSKFKQIIEDQEPSKRSKAVKKIRNIGLSIVILVVVLLIAGTVYVWYEGLHPAQDTAVVAQPQKQQFQIKHVKPAKNAKIGVAEESLTSPIKPGSNANIEVRTYPGATCKIKVEYNKVASKDSGLKTKIADKEFGMVDWSWTVEPTVPIGKWPITITCTANKQSAVLVSQLVVSNKAKS